MPTVKPGWLPQRELGQGAVLLRDFPLPVVRIACTRCDRAGRYSLAGLVERFGPAAGAPDVLEALSADCPRWQDWRPAGPYGAMCPDLVPKRVT